MGKTRDEIHEQIKQTLVGNFRGALNKATPLQAIGMEDVPDDLLGSKGQLTNEDKQKMSLEGERAQFRNELLKDINSDLASFGMKVVSVSLQKIWDSANYIANLAQKTLAQKRKQVEIEEARLRALAEQTESDGQRRIIIAKNMANEKIIAARQKLEVYRQEAEAQIEQAKLEADNAILEAQNKGERQVQELTVELKKLENFSQIILQEEAKQKAAEINANGEQEAINIIESTKNNILAQKKKLLAEAGDIGRMVLFVKQQLPYLFAAYKKYAEKQGIDTLVIMDDKQGINGAVNRGPAAFVDFLRHFENGLGISIKELLGQTADEEVKTC
jgi:regulator of protease activity HflC (stomatin/prohibitin superfamily)